MTEQSALPPHVGREHRVILFDGVCRLCNGSSQFIIRFDKRKVFKLCMVQSAEGQAILRHFGLPTETFATMLYVEGETCFVKSDAVLQIAAKLDFPWKLLAVFRFLPKGFRDWIYDRVATNRYKLFGKYDQCLLPTAENQQRFLQGDKPSHH